MYYGFGGVVLLSEYLRLKVSELEIADLRELHRLIISVLESKEKVIAERK